MQFVADFINDYFKEDEYHYIFLFILKEISIVIKKKIKGFIQFLIFMTI